MTLTMRLEPFVPRVATTFLEQLAQANHLPLSPVCTAKMLALIGTPVPYFLQILFSEVAKAYALDEEEITPEKVERIYRDKVLGVDYKPILTTTMGGCATTTMRAKKKRPNASCANWRQ